ncbi:hypothetical protein H4I96_01829 [Botrytis cinerea]
MPNRNNRGGSRPIQGEQPAQQNQLVVHTSNVIGTAMVRKALDRISPGIGAFLQALMDYAAIIYDVKIFIKAPSIITMPLRAKVIALLDDHDSYEQLELTIAAYKLNLHNWTLAYEVVGLDGKWNIPVGSEDELRLRHLYRKYFLKKL